MIIARPERNGGADSDPTPHGDAVPKGSSFVRVERLTHDRVDAVTPDQQVCPNPPYRAAGLPVNKLAPDLAVLLPEAGEVVAGVDASRAEPFEHGPMQDAEQLAAVNGDLRPAVAGGQATWFAPDPLAVPGVEDEFGGGDADRSQIVKETELGQLAHGVGHDVDTDAQFLHRRGRLEDLDVGQSGVVEGESEGHAADAAPDDGDLHAGFSVHPGPDAGQYVH